jgi:phosphoribosylformylglycinamidine synthase
VENNKNIFTRDYSLGEVISVPIAHGEGNFTADAETLRAIEEEGRVLFRYVDEKGERNSQTNINGASNAIAGFINEKGNVLGMMPHPENALSVEHGSTGGLALFTSLALQKVEAA